MGESTAGADGTGDAAHQRTWAETYEALSARDASELSPRDLEALADAAWWLSRMEESIAARQRAYTGSASAGDAEHAAGMAARLSIDHFTRGDPAIGAGWLMKAQRHAEEVPEGAGHGFLLIVEATVARHMGDLSRSRELVDRAVELARHLGDADLMAMAIHTKGMLLILAGDVAAGVALLDEAMTSVVAGQLSPFFTGIVYCNVIGTCLEIADVRRADQWSEAARVWCETLPPESPFPGMCRINRAEVARLRGAWPEAEAEATRASEELMGFDPMGAAQAIYETGEIRRRIGNLAGAEECFARAREIGFDPQPGLALLRSAQGNTDAALKALQVAVTAVGESRLQRARLLAALVDVAIEVPDLETATEAVDPTVGARRRIRRSDPGGDRRHGRRRRCPRARGDSGRRRGRSPCLRDVAGSATPLRGRSRADAPGARSSSIGRGGRCPARAPVRRLGLRTARRHARGPDRGQPLAGHRAAPREGSRRGRRRCSDWWPPASRTATSPPHS